MKKSLLALAVLAGISMLFMGCPKTTGNNETPADNTPAEETPAETVYNVSVAWDFTFTADNVTQDAANGLKVQLYENTKKIPFDLKIKSAKFTYDGNEVTLASPFVKDGVLKIAETDDKAAVQVIEALTSSGLAVSSGKTAKLELEGTTTTDITTVASIQATLVDNSEAAGWWKTITDGVQATPTVAKSE